MHGEDFSGNDVQKVVGNYQDIVNVVLEYRYWQNGNGVNIICKFYSLVNT